MNGLGGTSSENSEYSESQKVGESDKSENQKGANFWHSDFSDPD